MREWCSHIIPSTRGGIWMWQDEYHSGGADHWEYCPWCSTRKPKEPRVLWEVLSEPDYSNETRGKKDAMIALKWFKDNSPGYDQYSIEANLFAVKIGKWLDAEMERCK